MYNSTYRRRLSLLCLFARNMALLDVLDTILSVRFIPERVCSCLRTNETMLARLKACQDDVLLHPSRARPSLISQNQFRRTRSRCQQAKHSFLPPRRALNFSPNATLCSLGWVLFTTPRHNPLTFLCGESFITALTLYSRIRCAALHLENPLKLPHAVHPLPA